MISVLSSRNTTADLLKGLAVLFMIQVHIMEQFASKELQGTVIGKISMFLGGPACAPVFLAVMGYFLVSNEKPFIYYFKRGCLLFAGGIALNIARSANLLIQINRGQFNLDPLSFIFGADILTLAGISLLLIGLIRLIFKSSFYPWILLALFIAAVTPYLPAFPGRDTPFAYLMAFFYGIFDWSYFPVFPWFSYVLAGYAARLMADKPGLLVQVKTGTSLFYLIPAGAGLLYTLPWAASIFTSLNGINSYYHHGFLFFLWVIVFLFIYIAGTSIANYSFGTNRIVLIIRWIGQKVTLIYVIQWLIIGNLATIFFGTQNLLHVLLWIPAVILVTFFGAKLFSRIFP